MKNNTQMVSCIHLTTNWIPAKCEINTATEVSDGGQNIKGLIKGWYFKMGIFILD